MIRKGTWIVLGIFVVMAGALLILQKTRGNVKFVTEAATPSATSAPLLLQGWLAADINAIEWRSAGQLINLTQAADGSWLLGPDQNAPVDSAKVEVLRNALTVLRPLSSLGNDNPLDSLGLATPLNIITLRTTGGQQAQISLGAATPTGSGYYAQVNGGAPIVLEKFAVDALLEKLTLGYWATPTPAPATEIPALTTTPAP